MKAGQAPNGRLHPVDRAHDPEKRIDLKALLTKAPARRSLHGKYAVMDTYGDL